MAAAIHANVAMAWDTHGLITLPALEALPAVREAKPVPAESFEDFVAATHERLAPILEAEEAWARVHVPHYAPRPDALRWKTPASREQMPKTMMAALRVNPLMQLPLYRARLPQRAAPLARPIPTAEVSVIPASVEKSKPRLERLQAGELIAPLDILFTAVDEPDFGLDIGLWTDNGTAFGRVYEFGPQPFGNPELEFSSQAPFHMGFYFEDAIVYRAAPFLGKTYPEMRIHQFMTLARFALQNGHPYWGYRFLGWGLHYLQDLAQPYHASVLPGVATWRMLLINGIAMLGFEGPKNRAIHLVSNRHLALENFQWASMVEAYESGETQHPMLAAAANLAADERFGTYTDDYPRAKVAFAAHEAAMRMDQMLSELMPPQLVQDPDYIFSVSEPEINVAKRLQGEQQNKASTLVQVVVPLMEAVGAHSRAYVSYALENAASSASPTTP